tara:strand:+ start:30244 stop:30828 length:585 start_codon:yes stop_codon:yes gene_type:complete
MGMKKTKTYTYIFPMMDKILEFKPQIANLFLGDVNYPQYDGKILVLYKYLGSRDFLKYEEDIKKHSLFIDSYDPDSRHIMMVFNIPDNQKLNFLMYKDSKYSKMSEPYKIKILSYHRVSKEHPLYHILYRTEEGFQSLENDLKMEVPRHLETGSLLNMEEEKYNDSYKYNSSISPNLDFINKKSKPFIFNTKGD